MRVGAEGVGKERTLLVYLMESFSFLREVLSSVLVGGHRLVFPSSFGFFLCSPGVTSWEYLLFQGFFCPLSLLPDSSTPQPVPQSILELIYMHSTLEFLNIT